MGMPCDIRAILKVAKRHGLPVVEDAACAIGSQILIGDSWEHVGRPHGDIACFSFHPRKVMTTGDGGMLTTDDPEFDRRFRLWRQHSMSVPDTVRHGTKEVIFESYPDLGYNYRMTDIQAAIGRVQLRRVPGIVRRRRELGRRYRELLGDLAGLGLPVEPEWARTNWQSYCVRLPEDRPQKPVMQALLDRGIATRRGVMCAHREAAYPSGTWSCQRRGACACAPHHCEELQHSEQAQDHCIILPLYPQMSDDDQDRVVAAIRQVLEHWATWWKTST